MTILHTTVHNKPKFDIILLTSCELFSHLLLNPRHKRGILAIMKTSPTVSGWALTHLPSRTELGYTGWFPLRKTSRKYTSFFPSIQKLFAFPGRGPGDRIYKVFTGDSQQTQCLSLQQLLHDRHLHGCIYQQGTATKY